MEKFEDAPATWAVKDDGNVISIKDNFDKGYRNIHIIANVIDYNVLKSVINLISEQQVRKVVVNRTKIIFTPNEISYLEKLNDFLKTTKFRDKKTITLEILENSSSYSLYEIKEGFNRLSKEAEIIRNGYVIEPNGGKREFSPLEKLFAIHSIVENNYYSKNEDVLPDATRNLYSVLQRDRAGIVCLGYAKWFKALADMVDPNHKEFKVGIVASFFPKKRKEDYDYEKILGNNLFRNIYSEEEQSFHATNIVFVKDDYYEISGIYHNDPTFDSIRPLREEISFLHFMWPFHGYVKTEKKFIPMHVFHNKLSQAKNLGSLMFIKQPELKISFAYEKYLKYPKKKVYIKQKERVYKLLSSQIDKAKNNNINLGKDYYIKRNNNDEVYLNHSYTSWKQAIEDYVEKHNKEFKDNRILLEYVSRKGKLPDISNFSEDEIKDINFTISLYPFREAKKMIDEKYKIKNNDFTSKSLKILIEKNNERRLIMANKSLEKFVSKYKLPNIEDLYKEDADEILRVFLNYYYLIVEPKLLSYLKEEDMEQYRSYIDNILKTRGRFSLGQLNEKIQEKDKSEFKKIIENDDTEEIMYNSMVKIKENVGKYFKQQNEETLKEADVNIELF